MVGTRVRKKARRNLTATPPKALPQNALQPPQIEHLRAEQVPAPLRVQALQAAQPTLGNAAVARTLTRRQPPVVAPISTAEPQPQSTPVQRFFKKLWKGIKKGASAAWKGVKKGAGAAWNWTKGAAEKVWSGTKWVGRQLWTKITGIYHRAVNWFGQLPARLGRLFTTLWEGVKSLKPWSLRWWASLGKLSTWKAFLGWLGTSLVQLLEVAGIGEVYETLADLIKFNTRALTGGEIAKAKTVFGNSIEYSLVRVDQGALIGPAFSDRAYVSFHTINAWGPLDDHTLIHELTHVWQYGQSGAMYMPRALHAQKAGGYNYGGIAELRARKARAQGFDSFNLEQQGQITGDYYINMRDGSFTPSDKATFDYFINTVRR